MALTNSTYQNKEGVGAAIKTALNGGLKCELFITTKLWTKDMSEDKAKVAFETSLKKLQIDYADLYLIHWAIGNTYGVWWVIYINKTSSKQSGWATFIPHD